MSRSIVVLSLSLALWLSGCGEPERGKGPALPYQPEAYQEIKEADIPLAADLPKLRIKTSKGDLDIVLFEDEAPNSAANFITLAEKGFYNGLTFHRLEKDFCLQGGDPKGDGSGGPGYKLKPEFHDAWHRNLYGSLAWAKGPNEVNQSGSQFFINLKKGDEGNKHLDRQHVVFGKVLEKSYGVLEELARTKVAGSTPVEPLKIEAVEVLSKRSHPYQAEGIVKDRDPLAGPRVPMPGTEVVLPIPPAEPKEKEPAEGTEKKEEKKSEEKKSDERTPEKKSEANPEEQKSKAAPEAEKK